MYMIFFAKYTCIYSIYIILPAVSETAKGAAVL